MKRRDSEQLNWGDIPPILSTTALLDKGFKRAAKAKGKGRTKLDKHKSTSIARVQTLGDTIASTLEKYVKSFPSIERLPAFYRDLVDILVKKDVLKKDLGAIDWCRGKVLEFARAYVKEIGRQTDIPYIELRRKEAYGRISSIVQQVSKNLERLEESRFSLSKLPVIKPDMTTIVVAGIANVGKSQFVTAASSARPKIAQYPFTTKAVSMGHVERRYNRFQIVDTPGLLDRAVEDRNPIEKQAANALRHLAHVVVFLLDPSETCGYTMESQLNLLAKLRLEFPNVTFIEVENKLDLMNSGSSRRKVSALEGIGVDEVIDEVAAMLTNRAPEASPPRIVD